jgi:hypothetical protein
MLASRGCFRDISDAQTPLHHSLASLLFDFIGGDNVIPATAEKFDVNQILAVPREWALGLIFLL